MINKISLSTKDSLWPDWKIKLSNPIIEGGLRLSGKVKENFSEKPLISYVTVVRNNPHTIKRAIDSVIKQKYENVEHIVIDGASTDNTIDVILEYKDHIDYYASEPDNGLYDALNKAIELCRGELILVLNSDDWLSPDSANIAAELCKFNQPQLIAGTAHVMIHKDEGVFWHPQKVGMASYFTVANVNHNAIYATRAAYQKSGPYDVSYKIAADTKWILKCYSDGVIFDYTDRVTVNYSLGGISSDIHWHIEECKRIIKDKFPFLSGYDVIVLNYIYYQWREGFVFPFANFNPKVEIDKILKKYADRKEFLSGIDSEHPYIANFNESEMIIMSTFSRSLVNKIKRLLINSPMLYRLLKSIYIKLRRLLGIR